MEIFHPLVLSPGTHHCQTWARNSVQGSHVDGRTPASEAITCCLQGAH